MVFFRRPGQTAGDGGGLPRPAVKRGKSADTKRAAMLGTAPKEKPPEVASWTAGRAWLSQIGD
jgi:hypothetical protein